MPTLVATSVRSQRFLDPCLGQFSSGELGAIGHDFPIRFPDHVEAALADVPANIEGRRFLGLGPELERLAEQLNGEALVVYRPHIEHGKMGMILGAET